MKGLKFGGRMYVILIYDISIEGEGSRVARNVFKICKKYLSHVQKSVFEGELTIALLKKMQLEIDCFVRKEKDSVVIFSSRQKKWLEKEFWGMDESHLTSTFF